MSELEQKSIGFNLFIRNQYVDNPKTKLEYQLFFKSSVYYKLSVLKNDVYYPAEHIIVKVPNTNNLFKIKRKNKHKHKI